MTYHDDRNPNRMRHEDRAGSSALMWLVGIAAAVLVLGIIIYGVSDNRRTTASGPSPSPSATAPATTGAAAPTTPAPTTPPATPAPAQPR